MEALIDDSTADARMSGLERFLQRHLGPRQPEFGASKDRSRTFLVGFVLLLFGSELLAAAGGALKRFEMRGCRTGVDQGEYAWEIDRPSYFRGGGRFLVRRAG
ncbi:MAG: hypothetical protein JOY90_11325 [Bradyrhizobium sp.]|uniref:hypothetical protein n=1 Tax=Bradyrhizobium sp. TaxID=376 RepID=UPI001D3DF15D|nr:hypothetical protein [Bradyrhizobium sp.]MBV9561032.1 hypothetical protein [Bradyrhizobium sp.]